MLMSRSTRRFIVRTSVNRYDLQITRNHSMTILASCKTLASKQASLRQQTIPHRVSAIERTNTAARPTATEAPVACRQRQPFCKPAALGSAVRSRSQREAAAAPREAVEHIARGPTCTTHSKQGSPTVKACSHDRAGPAKDRVLCEHGRRIQRERGPRSSMREDPAAGSKRGSTRTNHKLPRRRVGGRAR